MEEIRRGKPACVFMGKTTHRGGGIDEKARRVGSSAKAGFLSLVWWVSFGGWCRSGTDTDNGNDDDDGINTDGDDDNNGNRGGGSANGNGGNVDEPRWQ